MVCSVSASLFQLKPIAKYSNLTVIFLVSFLEGAIFPLIPLSALVHFGFLFAKLNPFVLNYTFSAISLAITSVVAIFGLVVPLFHVLVDLHDHLELEEKMIGKRMKVYDAIYLSHLLA